jgi:flagellar M-ring protein FliF
MAESPAQSLGQLRRLAQGLTLRQQITILVGAAAVAGTLWLFVKLIGKADYKPLYSGLSPGETQSIARRLDERRVAYEISSDGTSLRVPADQVDKVRVELASKGLPQSGRLGFELFDKPNWAGSDFAEKVNYQRALEGELERTIQTLTDIEAVRVHLVLPHESIFTERERPAKASVVVKLRGGRLAEESFQAITHLVASAVDSMPPENVTVVDVNGHVPLLARRNGIPGRLDHADGFETSLAEKLVATLAPVVGGDRVKANVTVEYELGATENTQETYDPNGAVVLTSQVSEDRSGDAAPQGIPGTASNVPGKAEPSGAAAETEEFAESQSQRTESKTYAVSKTVRHVVMPAGGVRRVNAAVLVDDAVEVKEENGQRAETRRKRTPEEMKQIQEVAAAAIGIDTTRGDRLAVENLSFLPIVIEAPAEPSGVGRLTPYAERWIWLVRYLALAALFGLVYVLFLRPIKKQIVASVRQLAFRPGTESRGAPSLGAPTEKGAIGRGEATPEMEVTLPKELAETSADVKQAVTLKRHLVDKIQKEPGAASRLIQNWIRQAETGR